MSDEFQQVVSRLSDREKEVLGHLVHGDTYAAIAHRMNVSPHTVDTYLRRIRAKTGARSRMHLLLLALSTGNARAGAAGGAPFDEAPHLPARPGWADGHPV
ncbi:helix-turn-helix transcriptional regulator [Streptomyces sp. SID12488]|uniref:LuxR C-terminal-related transcriptional regulator n=1 Tax=Streptomyces sp. SID12488 TaxID=2706040 RepID=UPI0013DC76DF|nr:helix-turn-helix transcriptional regulator [Streptomyces sp. SID12488]